MLNDLHHSQNKLDPDIANIIASLNSRSIKILLIFLSLEVDKTKNIDYCVTEKPQSLLS